MSQVLTPKLPIEDKSYFEEKRALINARLDALIPAFSKEHQIIFDAARYSLLSGGKRLRPILTLAVLEIYGFPPSYGLDAALCLEMIHTYSLIHDDLPCMDDDDLRRGCPTLHKKFGEAIALLAGDYLLTLSFEIMSNLDEISKDKKIALISTLAKAAGGFGMIGGQVMDMESENKQIPLVHLKLLHQKKTGALITAALNFGAIMAEVSPDDAKILHDFGKNIGIAFQIIDDILDMTESSDVIGKNALSDVENGKSTYVTLLGVEGSMNEAKALHGDALKLLEKLSVPSEPLKVIADKIICRRN